MQSNREDKLLLLQISVDRTLQCCLLGAKTASVIRGRDNVYVSLGKKAREYVARTGSPFDTTTPETNLVKCRGFLESTLIGEHERQNNLLGAGKVFAVHMYSIHHLLKTSKGT